MTAPLAFQNNPAFTAEYWEKAPRRMTPATIERLTNKDEGWVEIVLKEGARFMRMRSELKQLLTPNLPVQVEAFSTPQGVIITGLFVPGTGWAFRMTAQDLADYAKEVAVVEEARQRVVKAQIVNHVADSIIEYFGIANEETDHTPGEYKLPATFVPTGLAAHIVSAMERGPE